MTERRGTGGHRGTRRAAATVAGTALLAVLAGCGSPTDVGVAAGPALAAPPTLAPPPTPVATVKPGTGATPGPGNSPGPGPTTTPTRGATSAPASPDPTPTAQLRRLIRGTIIADDRSLSVLRPAAWSPTRADTEPSRNRTFYQDSDHRYLIIVEISPATATNPYASALQFASNRQSSLKNSYAAVGTRSGPDGGASVEYYYTDPAGGQRRHAIDWFATVGSTDVALFAAGPSADWASVHRLWQRMVDSVRAGPNPPGYAGPGSPTAGPSPAGSATDSPTTGGGTTGSPSPSATTVTTPVGSGAALPSG